MAEDPFAPATQASSTDPFAPVAPPQATLRPQTPLGSLEDQVRLGWQRTVLPTLKKVGGTVAKTLGVPLTAANAVLGAPQRFESGAIGSEEVGAKPGEHRTLPVTGILGANAVVPTLGNTLIDPGTRKAFGAGMWGVLHPNSQAQLNVQGERATGIENLFDKILPKAGDNVPITFTFTVGAAPVPITLTGGQWKQLGKDTVYENATDPINLMFLAGAARRTATKYIGTGLGKVADALATTAEAVPAAGAHAYSAIPGAVERAGNFVGGHLARLATAGIKVPDIAKTERALAAARQAGDDAEVQRLQSLLNQQRVQVSHGSIGRAYRERQRGATAGTQFVNLVRSNPHIRRAFTQEATRSTETGDNIANNYVRSLEQHADQVFHENEQAIVDAENAAKARRAALRAQGNMRSATEVQSEIPPAVRQLTKQLAYVRGTDAVKAQVIADGYVPTDFEKNLPTIGTLTAYKPDYVPHHTLIDTPQDLLPGEERTGPYRVNPATQGIHSQLIPEPEEVPLLARLRNKVSMDIREMSPSGNNMLAKSIHLNGLRDQGIPGLSLIAPDIELTQRQLESARMADDQAQVARLSKQLDTQRATAAAQKAEMLSRIRQGVEDEPLVPLGHALEETGQSGQYLTQAQLEKAKFPQALENLGLTPERLGEIHGTKGAPDANTPLMKYGSREKQLDTRQAFLSGRQSLAAHRAAISERTNKAVQTISDNIARIVNADLSRAERTAQRTAEATQTRATRMASSYESKLAATQGAGPRALVNDVARPAQQAAELAQARAAKLVPALERQRDRLIAFAKTVEGQDKRILEHDARLLDYVVKGEKYNAALASAHAEAERLAALELDRMVPKAWVRQYASGKVAQPAITGFTLPTKIAKMFMFMNPFVHGGKNIPVLRAISQGTTFSSIVDTIGMPAKEEASLVERLKNSGGLTTYREPLPADAGKFAHAKNELRGITEAMDTRIRAGMLKDLDKSDELDPFTGKPYKSMNDYEKAAVINESLGEYQHESELSRTLSRYGFPFPHWRFTMMARILKAMMTQPHRMNLAIRTMLDFNRDMFSKDPYQLGFYTPIDTGLEGLDPATVTKFLTGLGGPTGWLTQRGNIMQRIEKLGATLPLGGPLEAGLGLDPYGNKATKRMPRGLQTILAVPAIYPEKKVKGVNEPAPEQRAPVPTATPASDPFAPAGQ